MLGPGRARRRRADPVARPGEHLAVDARRNASRHALPAPAPRGGQARALRSRRDLRRRARPETGLSDLPPLVRRSPGRARTDERSISRRDAPTGSRRSWTTPTCSISSPIHTSPEAAARRPLGRPGLRHRVASCARADDRPARPRVAGLRPRSAAEAGGAVARTARRARSRVIVRQEIVEVVQRVQEASGQRVRVALARPAPRAPRCVRGGCAVTSSRRAISRTMASRAHRAVVISVQTNPGGARTNARTPVPSSSASSDSMRLARAAPCRKPRDVGLSFDRRGARAESRPAEDDRRQSVRLAALRA